jgi:hypothetical protein
MADLEIVTSPRDLYTIEEFEYHPKVRARLVAMLEQIKQKYTVCTSDELKGVQEAHKILATILVLPATVLKEEKEKTDAK